MIAKDRPIMAKADGWVARASRVAASAVAMVVLVSPLALWVSWTAPMFVGVAVGGAAAAVFYCLLDWLAGPAGRDRHPAPREATVSPLDDTLVAALSNLNPMVYHNRLTTERELRTTFDRIKRALAEPPPRAWSSGRRGRRAAVAVGPASRAARPELTHPQRDYSGCLRS